jgi:Glycosyl transferase family 2
MRQAQCIGTISYMGGVMSVPETFAWAWAEMRQFSAEALCQLGQYVHADRATVSLHSAARNYLAGSMRGDWLLMLDTDLDFEADLCARMVQTMNTYSIDVLTGVYCFKNPPNTPVLYLWNEETEKAENIGSIENDGGPRIFQIGAAGGGCLMIRRRVFDRIREELGEQPFDHVPNKHIKGATMGEDHSFFHRCRLLGIKAYCAWDIHALHLRNHGVDPDFRPQVQELTTREVMGVALAG